MNDDDQGSGSNNRARLVRWRREGRRLIASDEERLHEYETADAFFCDMCGIYFAGHNEPREVMREKRTEHVRRYHRGPDGANMDREGANDDAEGLAGGSTDRGGGDPQLEE